MDQFQSKHIKSKHYNYTVDYFELRAQPGRDGTALPSADQYWYRDETNGVLYPLFVDDGAVIGGTSLFGSEKLRVVGDVYMDGTLRFAQGYIETGSGELTFYDQVVGEEVTLSSLLTSSWTRDDVNGWLRPTNSGDDILIGLSSGNALRRLQIASEANDGSSYLIWGEDSAQTSIFSVDDLGNMALSGDIVFALDAYLRYTPGLYSFAINASSYFNITDSYIYGEDANSFRINLSNPYYSFTEDIDTGLGLVGLGQPAIFIGGTNLYNFIATQFSLPQEAWIYAGRDLLRVNATGQIELGSFVFDDATNQVFYFRPDAYIYADALGGMWFKDDTLNNVVSLADLASMANVYWERDNVENIVYPATAADNVRIPSIATGSIEHLFIDAQGTLMVGGIPDFVFSNDINVTLSGGKSLGKYTNGDTIPATGMTIEELMWDIAQEYINASFTSFSVNGQATIVEVGTTLSGTRGFVWGIDEGSGDVNLVDIYDVQAGTNIATDIANDGSETVTITTRQLNANGLYQQWYAIGTDETPDPDVDFNSSTFTVFARFYRFYGPSATTPTDDTTVRALPSSDWQTGVNTFNLWTGTTYTKFVVALPPDVNITSVIDVTALNADITSEYVLLGTVTVIDAGSTSRSYNLYEMNIATPYGETHQHRITAL